MKSKHLARVKDKLAADQAEAITKETAVKTTDKSATDAADPPSEAANSEDTAAVEAETEQDAVTIEQV